MWGGVNAIKQNNPKTMVPWHVSVLPISYHEITQAAEITLRSIIPCGDYLYVWSSLGDNEYVLLGSK